MTVYQVERCYLDGRKAADYGTMPKEDMQAIIRGWHFNGMFYERKGANSIIIVTEKEV